MTFSRLTPHSRYVGLRQDFLNTILLTIPERVPKITVADPAIVSVTPLSPTELLIYGKQPGRANLVVSTEDGQVICFQINVLGPTSVVVVKKAKG